MYHQHHCMCLLDILPKTNMEVAAFDNASNDITMHLDEMMQTEAAPASEDEESQQYVTMTMTMPYPSFLGEGFGEEMGDKTEKRDSADYNEDDVSSTFMKKQSGVETMDPAACGEDDVSSTSTKRQSGAETMDPAACREDDAPCMLTKRQSSGRARLVPNRLVVHSFSSNSSASSSSSGFSPSARKGVRKNKKNGAAKKSYTQEQRGLLLNAFEDYCTHPERWRMKRGVPKKSNADRKRGYSELPMTSSSGEGNGRVHKLVELSRRTGLSTVQVLTG